jgi:hypothetical protein
MKHTIIINILLTISILLASLFAACKTEENSLVGPISSPGIVPLSVGNKWIRSIELYDTSGNVFSTWIDSIIVTRDTIAEGSRWFMLKMGGLEYPMVNRSNGLWCLNGGGIAFMWYKFPAVVGDSFLVGDPIPMRVRSVDTTITVPQGAFSCYSYEQDHAPWLGAIGGSRVIEFLAPEGGYVKTEVCQSTFTSKTQFLYSTIRLTALRLK